MNNSLDHIFARPADLQGKLPAPPARRGPGWEIIVIAVSIALPLTVYCGRLIKQRIDDQAALAAPEPERPKRRSATQVHVAAAGEDKPRPPQDATARVARPESSMGVAGARQQSDAPAGVLNSVVDAQPKPTPATPFAKRQGVPPGTRAQPSATDHQHDEAGDFDAEGNVSMAGPPGHPMSGPVSPIQAAGAQAAVVSLDLDLENALVNAWGLIERGDHDLGRRVLAEAGKRNKDDIRVDFSLGLLDALLDHNWLTAEKRFAECVRREPENTASMNNLALARLRLTWDKSALKPWEVILEQDSTPPEVLQNLGRVRTVLQGGRMPKNPALADAADRLYLKASIAAGKSSQPRTGFLYMGLTLADGRTVGWTESKKYEDTWCTVCQGSSQMRCPNPACVRGTVKLPKLQGGGRTRCNTCRGSGLATCNACSRGRDRSLTYYPSAPVRGPVNPAAPPAVSPALPSPSPPPSGAAPPVTSSMGPLVPPAPLAPGLKK